MKDNFFTLYPAIDIKNGKCVRLLFGEMEKETVYNNNPLDQAMWFVDQGAEWLHIVDLDGAVAGENINKRVIEKILHNHEGIREVCVIGVSDLRTGEKVKAIVVPERSFSKSHFLNLKDWCSKHMAKYKIPKIFEIRKSLPKNKMGKVLWKNLK